MSKWHLPTGRTVQEFLDAQTSNLKHDAEHLIGQIRQGHQRIEELEESGRHLVDKHDEFVDLLSDANIRNAKLQSRIDAGLKLTDGLTDLCNEIQDYGCLTWSKQLAKKIDKLREALGGRHTEVSP